MPDRILQHSSNVVMLALVIWREARGEPEEARIGVAHVVLNRVRRPGWWGATMLEVLTKPWQFSSLTDPKDRQLTKWPKESDPSWMQCLRIARRAILGASTNPIGDADHYHDTSIEQPAAWGTGAKLRCQLGRLKFYRVGGAGGAA